MEGYFHGNDYLVQNFIVITLNHYFVTKQNHRNHLHHMFGLCKEVSNDYLSDVSKNTINVLELNLRYSIKISF